MPRPSFTEVRDTCVKQIDNTEEHYVARPRSPFGQSTQVQRHISLIT